MYWTPTAWLSSAAVTRVQASATLADAPVVVGVATPARLVVDEAAGAGELLQEHNVNPVTPMNAADAASRRGLVGARIGVSLLCWHGLRLDVVDARRAKRAGNRGKPSIWAAVWRRRSVAPYVQAMQGFLVERYWPGVTSADVRDVDDQLTGLSGSDARFLASTLIPADEVVFFEFWAVDDAAVRELAGRAGLPCDRLVAAERTVIDP